MRVRVTPVDPVRGHRRPRLDAAAFRVRVGEAGCLDLRPQSVQRGRVFVVGAEDVLAFGRRRRVTVGDAVDAGDPLPGDAGRTRRLGNRRIAFGREFTGQIRFERALTADVATEEGGHRGQAHLLLVTHQSGVAGHPGVHRGVELFRVAPFVGLFFTGDGLEVRAGFAGEADVVRVFGVEFAEDVFGREDARFGFAFGRNLALGAFGVGTTSRVFLARVIAVGLPDGVVGVVVAAHLHHLEPRVGIVALVLAAFVETGALEVRDV